MMSHTHLSGSRVAIRLPTYSRTAVIRFFYIVHIWKPPSPDSLIARNTVRKAHEEVIALLYSNQASAGLLPPVWDVAHFTQDIDKLMKVQRKGFQIRSFR